MSNDANALKRKEQIKKWLIYAGMGLLFLVSMYFIFKPSKEQVQAEQQKVGFNAELPDPRGAGIEADKIAAYELEDMRVKQEQKMRTLEDFTAMTTDDEEEEVVEIPEEPRYTGGDGSSYRSGSRSNSFSTSTSAYNDINATLGSFYEQPREAVDGTTAEQPADICRPGGTLGEVIRACSEVYARRYCYNLRERSRGGGDHHTKRQGEGTARRSCNDTRSVGTRSACE